MYKVLDNNNNKNIVDKIDIEKHFHISGRKFTKDDNVTFVSVAKKVIEKTMPSTKKETKETTKPLVSKKKK